jgi:hypothetical protein
MKSFIKAVHRHALQSVRPQLAQRRVNGGAHLCQTHTRAHQSTLNHCRWRDASNAVERVEKLEAMRVSTLEMLLAVCGNAAARFYR